MQRTCICAAVLSVLGIAGCGGGGPSIPEGTDLIVSSITGDTFADWGGGMSMQITCRNRGKTDADADPEVRCYLSDDDQLDGLDTLLGSHSALAADFTAQTDYPYNDPVTLPSGSGEGNYYLVYVINEDSSVTEEIDTNNTLAYPIYVGPRTQPDFELVSMFSPGPYLSAHACNPMITVRNNGVPFSGECAVNIYMSTVDHIDGSAVHISTFLLSNMAFGEERTVTPGAIIPAATSSGGYYFLAMADPDGLIPEGNEGNNEVTGDYAYVRYYFPGDDAYEPDDYPEFARVLQVNGAAQRHTHWLWDEQDWMVFTLTTGMTVSIETFNLQGTYADTILTLYDNALNQLAWDDDGGANYASRIDITLGPGTYYVLCEEYDWGGVNNGASYDIRITGM